VLMIGRVLQAVLAGCAVAVIAGCSSADESPDGPAISVTTMRGALLTASDIGPTWSVPPETPSPDQLVSFCGGVTAAPPVPGGPSVVMSLLVDEGSKGAQSLNQIALVYGDAAAAQAGLATLRAVADACPATVTVPEQAGEDRQEPAYTEAVTTSALDEGGWTGFVLERRKLYDPKHPAAADTALAVVAKRNVLFVDAYAVYRLGAASSAPQFSADWKKLVGTALNRVDG
jgi:hypothetical protein